MIQLVIDWVSARSDVTQIYLHVQTNNEDALRFYQVSECRLPALICTCHTIGSLFRNGLTPAS